MNAPGDRVEGVQELRTIGGDTFVGLTISQYLGDNRMRFLRSKQGFFFGIVNLDAKGTQSRLQLLVRIQINLQPQWRISIQ